MPKRQLVAGHGRGHAQRGVAVVVAQAHAEADELAERVELLGHQLARWTARRRTRARERSRSRRNSVTMRSRASSHVELAARRHGLVSRPSAAIVWCSDKPLGQRRPRFTGWSGSPCTATARPSRTPSEHPAADRAVAAGRAHPASAAPAGADRARTGSSDVGVAIAAVVDPRPEPRPGRRPSAHRSRALTAGTPPEKEPGMLSGHDGRRRTASARRARSRRSSGSASTTRPARGRRARRRGVPKPRPIGQRPEPAELEPHRSPPRPLAVPASRSQLRLRPWRPAAGRTPAARQGAVTGQERARGASRWRRSARS